MPYSHTCVVARTNNEVIAIQRLLNAIGIPSSQIQPNKPATNNENSVQIATVHRIKGLEFDQIFFGSANEGLVPLNYAMENKADETSRYESETEERALMFVAITRARKAAYVLSYGVQSSLLNH